MAGKRDGQFPLVQGMRLACIGSMLSRSCIALLLCFRGVPSWRCTQQLAEFSRLRICIGRDIISNPDASCREWLFSEGARRFFSLQGPPSCSFARRNHHPIGCQYPAESSPSSIGDQPGSTRLGKHRTLMLPVLAPVILHAARNWRSVGRGLAIAETVRQPLTESDIKP